MLNENATGKVLHWQNLSCLVEELKMDLLRNVAEKFGKLLSVEYYFEIARKNERKEFVLDFLPQDFHHICGLHKLSDIGLVQTGARDKIYRDILNGRIGFSDIEKSNYFEKMSDRLILIGQIEEMLNDNQIVFNYLKNKRGFSRIEAEYLLENAHENDIIYIFLNERSKANVHGIPIMCCRSFFPMNQMDYTKNQPSYTLLKKIRTDTVTGEKIVQYDRSKILERAKAAPSETERRSILAQLNEKKAQAAIRDVLDGKRGIRKDKQEHEK